MSLRHFPSSLGHISIGEEHQTTALRLQNQDKVHDITHSRVEMRYFSPLLLQETERGLDVPSDGIQEWFPQSYSGINHEKAIQIDSIEISDELIRAYREYFQKTLEEFTGYSQPRCNGYLVGLSGGIDSAVVLGLIRDAGLPVTPLIMGRGDHNLDSEKYAGTLAEWIDIQYAKNLCQDLKIPFEYLDTSHILDSFESSFPDQKWISSGISPRVRSALLYTFADAHNLISAGSTNGTEYILAAYSVGGPAGHISPLIDLYKSEVYALARKISIPEYVQKRKPLISELNLADQSLYGVDCTILDPVLRRLWFQKQTPEIIATELGHDVGWIQDIKKLRIDGEKCRRTPTPFLINRPLETRIDPTIIIDRSYFDFDH